MVSDRPIYPPPMAPTGGQPGADPASLNHRQEEFASLYLLSLMRSNRSDGHPDVIRHSALIGRCILGFGAYAVVARFIREQPQLVIDFWIGTAATICSWFDLLDGPQVSVVLQSARDCDRRGQLQRSLIVIVRASASYRLEALRSVASRLENSYLPPSRPLKRFIDCFTGISQPVILCPHFPSRLGSDSSA